MVPPKKWLPKQARCKTKSYLSTLGPRIQIVVDQKGVKIKVILLYFAVIIKTKVNTEINCCNLYNHTIKTTNYDLNIDQRAKKIIIGPT